MQHKDKVIIAGGSGLLGMSLTKNLVRNGYQPVVLTRSNEAENFGIIFRHWDGKSVGDWASELEGAKALVNLTGRSVSCIHNEKNKAEILNSRLDSVAVLREALSKLTDKPRVWVQASSLAVYEDNRTYDAAEDGAHGSGYTTEVCKRWEEIFFREEPFPIRKVALRIGFVLSPDGGALPALTWLTKRFLGGTVASGKQCISWIHIDDMTQIFMKGIEDEMMSGVYNATSPTPVTNALFMRELRAVLHYPWSPPAPEWAVKIGAKYIMKAEPFLALDSKRSIPKRLLDSGFIFQHPNLSEALNNLLKK